MNMFGPVSNTPPLGVYVVGLDENDEYYLTPSNETFEVKGKNYGKMEEHANIFWKSYCMAIRNTGVLLTGNAGSGKTRTLDITCRLSLDAGQPVIIVNSSLKVNLHLIKYLDSFDNVTLHMDEFGKTFDLRMQSKMLGMLSGNDARKKFILMTENSSMRISEFILNRPGRARYHKHFGKVEQDIFDEFLEDHDITVTFEKDLRRLYSGSLKFSFDQLQALVTEHMVLPDTPLDELLTFVNVSELNKPEMVKVISCKTKVGDEYVDCKSTVDREISYQAFTSGRMVYINSTVPAEDPSHIKRVFFSVNKDKIKSIDPDTNDMHFNVTDAGMDFDLVLRPVRSEF